MGFLILVPKIAPKILKAVHLGPFEAHVSWVKIIKLDWQDSSISYVIEFNVKGDTSPAKKKVVSSQDSTVVLSDLRQNTTYVVFVLAVNSVGTKKSEAKFFTTNSCKYFICS